MIIGMNPLNPNDDSYEYMYYSNSNVDDGMMNKLNDWYIANIEGTATEKNVVESSFCEQAKVTQHNNSGATLKAGLQLMEPATDDYIPSLKCMQDANGKGLLNLKIGLLTVDEAILAGYPFYTETKRKNTNVYLHNGTYWRTISPAGFNNDARAWYMNIYGYAESPSSVSANGAVRPCFSLSSDTQVDGIGTIDDPFVLKNVY